MDLVDDTQKVRVQRPQYDGRGWFAAVNGELSPSFSVKDDADRWVHEHISEIVLVCRSLKEQGRPCSPHQALTALRAEQRDATEALEAPTVSQAVLSVVKNVAPVRTPVLTPVLTPEPAAVPVSVAQASVPEPEPERTVAATGTRLINAAPRRAGSAATPKGIAVTSIATEVPLRRVEGAAWFSLSSGNHKTGTMSKMAYKILQDAGGRALTTWDLVDALSVRGYETTNTRNGSYRSVYVTMRRMTDVRSGKDPSGTICFWIPQQ